MYFPQCPRGTLPSQWNFIVQPEEKPSLYDRLGGVYCHAQLKIAGKEWEAFLDDFRQTLDKFKVPAEEQAELKAIVNSTRSDIVADSALGAGANS
jgi:hypothetical protein